MDMKEEKPRCLIGGPPEETDGMPALPHEDADGLPPVLSDGTEKQVGVFAAKTEKLGEVSAFVDAFLEAHDCPLRVQMQLDLCLEEVFVNIANYAYPDGTGDVTVEISAQENAVTLSLIDAGIPFDPLKREDPDILLSADEREIGGLGIFLVKKNMDAVNYRREDGNNIITMRKSWPAR